MAQFVKEIGGVFIVKQLFKYDYSFCTEIIKCCYYSKGMPTSKYSLHQNNNSDKFYQYLNIYGSSECITLHE